MSCQNNRFMRWRMWRLFQCRRGIAVATSVQGGPFRHCRRHSLAVHAVRPAPREIVLSARVPPSRLPLVSMQSRRSLWAWLRLGGQGCQHARQGATSVDERTPLPNVYKPKLNALNDALDQ